MVCFRRFGSTVTYEVCTLFWKEEKRKKETRLDAATLVPSAHRVSPGLFTPRFFGANVPNNGGQFRSLK